MSEAKIQGKYLCRRKNPDKIQKEVDWETAIDNNPVPF